MIDGPETPLFGLRPLARTPQRAASDPAAGDALAASPGGTSGGRDTGQGPDFDAWLDEVRGRRDYDGELVHVERLPERPARHAAPQAPLPPVLGGALRALGIEQLYTHQAEAIDHVRAGRSVVLVTGTASGKTLAYNLPAVEALLADPSAHALYLFPTKALAQDQLKSLGRLLDAAPGGELRGRVHPGVYDGDTSTSARRKLRQEGNLILTTMDEESLKEVARLTGGTYYRATDRDSLLRIYNEIDALEKTELKVKEYYSYTELYPRFLAAALLLLLLSHLLRSTWLWSYP